MKGGLNPHVRLTDRQWDQVMRSLFKGTKADQALANNIRQQMAKCPAYEEYAE